MPALASIYVYDFCLITVANLQQLSSNEWKRNLDTASNLEQSTAETVNSLDERLAALEERFQKVNTVIHSIPFKNHV